MYVLTAFREHAGLPTLKNAKIDGTSDDVIPGA